MQFGNHSEIFRQGFPKEIPKGIRGEINEEISGRISHRISGIVLAGIPKNSQKECWGKYLKKTLQGSRKRSRVTSLNNGWYPSLNNLWIFGEHQRKTSPNWEIYEGTPQETSEGISENLQEEFLKKKNPKGVQGKSLKDSSFPKERKKSINQWKMTGGIPEKISNGIPKWSLGEIFKSNHKI